MDYATGIDISLWQDDNSTVPMFDPWKARDKGASFVGIKVSQGLYADPDFEKNWENCKGVLYRMPYHFLTWDVNAIKQADLFHSLIKDDLYGTLPLMVDFEWWKTTPSAACSMLYSFLERMKELTSKPLGLYTSKSFWEPSGSGLDYWKQYALWLCDITGEVEVPAPWTGWTFWQYTFKLDGLAWGSESLDLDGDYFNGTLEDMKKKYNLPELESKEGEATTMVWNKMARGIYWTQLGGTISDELVDKYDFVINECASDTTDFHKNVQTAYDREKPILLSYANDPELYLQMGLGNWPSPDKDPQLIQLKKILLSNGVMRAVQGIMLDCSKVTNSDGTNLTPAWISQQSTYMLNLISDTFGIPVFMYMNKSPLTVYPNDQSIIGLIDEWGISTNYFVNTIDDYPVDSEYPTLPYSGKNGWDFWLYSVSNSEWKILYNATKESLYEDLSFGEEVEEELPEVPEEETNLVGIDRVIQLLETIVSILKE